MTTHSSILAWRILGQRSLVGCSPLGCKELDVHIYILPGYKRMKADFLVRILMLCLINVTVVILISVS